MRDALAAGFGGEVDGRVDGEPAGARLGVPEEERPTKVLAEDVVVALEDLGLVDDLLLAGEFPAVAFDRDHLRRVEVAHELEVLALSAELHEFSGHSANAHDNLLLRELVRRLNPITIHLRTRSSA